MAPSRHCHGITKRNVRCRNGALDGEAFCAIHLRLPPRPGFWKRLRVGLAVASEISDVILASEVVYRVIEFVAKHHPIHFAPMLEQKLNVDYWELSQIIGADDSDLSIVVINSGGLDWSIAVSLYVRARQIATEGVVHISDKAIFEDFNEWFLALDDSFQEAVTEDPQFWRVIDELYRQRGNDSTGIAMP